MVLSLGVGMGGRDKKKESQALQGEEGKRKGKKTVWESQEHLYFAF